MIIELRQEPMGVFHMGSHVVYHMGIYNRVCSVVKSKNDQAPTEKNAVCFAVFGVCLVPQQTVFPFTPSKTPVE